MMVKWFLVIVVSSTLWTTCLSDNECTSTISNTSEIIFTCLSNVTIDELPLYNYTTSELASITSIVVNGVNDTIPGPFTSIPPNICLLSNLKTIDFSYNRITQVDPAGALSKCLSVVTTFDVSYNSISEFPSVMIYNMPILRNIYFQHNRLIEVPSNAFFNAANLEIIDFSYNNLTAFELWALLAKTRADFSHNRISTITNKHFFDMPLNISYEYQRAFYLNNNSPTINFTDAIYEMYNSCDEVIDVLGLPGAQDIFIFPGITFNLAYVYFGTTQISCSCDQAYILQMLSETFGQLAGMVNFPIYNATCTNGINFVLSSCAPSTIRPNSTVDFSQVYPRQCKILQSEAGDLTNAQNISVPTLNASTYPHYETELMNPGACFFTFSNRATVRIKCTNDISGSSTIPSILLSTTYFSNITAVDFTSSISSLPPYLCSLPSREIDLSYQSFTTLNTATFPCLDSFNKVTLSHNQLTSVNMPNGNFTRLTTLDLSSNKLTTLPYSILIPTPSSLRYLDLRNNSITSIDLFLYTLKNIIVDLRDNPINSSSIINPRNVTLSSGNNTNSTVAVILPSSVTNSTYIFNDQTALTAGTCNRNTVLTYRDTLRSAYNNVLLDCTCASINLKEIFLRSGSVITDSFTCSNGATAANFSMLTMSSCASTALNFSMGLCYNESLQTSTDDTIMGALRNTIQIISTILINLSFSSNITQNQQYTGLDLYTPQTNNSSNQSSTIYLETITSKSSSHSDVTSASATNNSNQMATSSSIDTTTIESATSSLSSTMLMINTTATITDSNIMITTAWTTTTTTTTTSTSTSTSTSTTSTSTSSTSTTTTTVTTTSASTSTTSTTATTTSTSTSTTTTTATTTSTSTSSSSTSATTSTSSTSTSSTSATTSTSSTSTTTTTVTTTSTSTSTTSTTATTTSTSTSTTTTTATTTSTSTSSSSTSATTSTSSTSTSSTSATTSTSSTSTSTSTSVTTVSDEIIQASSGGSDSSSSRTGLIVGLVLGLVGFFALVGGLIAAIVIAKSKAASSAAAVNTSIGRATAISQAPPDALLESRLQTRNLRSVRLAPLLTQPSKLPQLNYGSVAPVTVTTDPSTSAFNRSNLRASARGIPVQLDPIRSPSNIVPQYVPNSSTSNNMFNYNPTNNSSVLQRPLSQQQFQKPGARQPRSSQMLNTGGDTRY